MINAQDNVEKWITFALAHLFAFAPAKLFLQTLEAMFALHSCCCPCTDCHVKYGIRGNGAELHVKNVSIGVAMAAQLEL